ncbi:MAG TPA: GDSL-type esterase/lipase family protein [Dehalococcoidia bacterium]|nr:GDSL-type esterase/lipase family protein [Dehalococcoidia bacterium]
MGRLLLPPLAAFFFLALLLTPGAPAATGQTAGTPAYVAIGDSIAFGVGAPQPRTGGYVGLVHKALQTSDRYRESGLQLVNLAVPGATTADLLLPGGQLDSALEAIRAGQEDPAGDEVQIISVNVGGNDLLQLATPASPCFETIGSDACIEEFGDVLSSVQQNLSEALRRLREAAPEAGIYLLDLYNPYSGTGDTRETVADLAVQNLNGIIGANAANEDLNIRLASIFQLFRGRGLQWIAADGIHPNENGHRVIGEVLLATIDNREPVIPAELLEQTPAPAASPDGDLPDLQADDGSGADWLVWVLVPLAFAGGILLAGAYFWARGRS